MSLFKPKFISFDGYGALITVQMGALARSRFADRISAGDMDQFVRDFASFRLDEVLGEWKPYRAVIAGAVDRLTHLWGVEHRDADADAFYAGVATWPPHEDAPAALAKISQAFPLVILANGADEPIAHNLASLGAPFHAVFTSDQARAYKPRLRAFKFMLESLDCGPEEVLHVASSFRYDLMSADDLGLRHKVFVARGYEPAAPGYGCVEIPDLGGLASLVGL